MSVLRFLLSGLMLLTASVAAGELVNTHGNVKMQGEIVEAACYVDPRDRDLLVEFGDMSAREISDIPEGLTSHNFSIHLRGCSLASPNKPGSVYHSASITFTGNTDRHNKNLFVAYSPSDSFGIELFDYKGRNITPGVPSPDYELSAGSNVLRFRAALVSHDRHVTAGEFSAVAHFVIDYQ
ncbi:fimbrial protein [Jejubacter sp. L23]|uniref:fimbrial protein n=1 Tax=Jejubacter sp. L23 TaxID=3092086 RepID=UPI003D7390C3